MVKRFISLVMLVPVLSLFLVTQCLVLDLRGERQVEKKRYIDGKLQTEAAEKPCADEAIAILKEHDSIGYDVYKKSGSEDFLFWIDCSDIYFSLPGAVHESVHMLSDSGFTSYSYYLPSGENFSVKQKRLFNRSKIAAYLKPEDKDDFYTTYLTGQGGAQGFLVLLDEVNAYTFSLLSQTSLAELLPADVQVNATDGLYSMLLFLELYLHHGRTKVMSDYEKIAKDKKCLSLIKILWENAEKALIGSSKYKNLGTDDTYKLMRVYEEANIAELKKLYQGSGMIIAFDPRAREMLGDE